MTGPWWGLAGLVVGLAGVVLLAAWRPRLMPLVALAAFAVLCLGGCTAPAWDGECRVYCPGYVSPAPPPSYTLSPTGEGGYVALPW